MASVAAPETSVAAAKTAIAAASEASSLDVIACAVALKILWTQMC